MNVGILQTRKQDFDEAAPILCSKHTLSAGEERGRCRQIQRLGNMSILNLAYTEVPKLNMLENSSFGNFLLLLMAHVHLCSFKSHVHDHIADLQPGL